MNIVSISVYLIRSRQIIATSHDLGPQKVAKEGKSPYFRNSQRLVKYYNLARLNATGTHFGDIKQCKCIVILMDLTC